MERANLPRIGDVVKVAPFNGHPGYRRAEVTGIHDAVWTYEISIESIPGRMRDRVDARYVSVVVPTASQEPVPVNIGS